MAESWRRWHLCRTRAGPLVAISLAWLRVTAQAAARAARSLKLLRHHTRSVVMSSARHAVLAHRGAPRGFGRTQFQWANKPVYCDESAPASDV
jgi:hypothetical protein